MLTHLKPPANIDEAEAVATGFVRALYGGDHKALRRIATDEVATSLLDAPASGTGTVSRIDAQVEAALARDLHPDRVLFDVVVRAHPDLPADVVAVALGFLDSRWVVTDVAF